MSAMINPVIQKLLDAAARDEQTLDFPRFKRDLGFHVQEAIEKLLKALIAGSGRAVVFTHDLERLATELQSLREQIPVGNISYSKLTEYGVKARYSEGPDRFH